MRGSGFSRSQCPRARRRPCRFSFFFKLTRSPVHPARRCDREAAMGSIIVLSGPIGAGKSTVAREMVRTADPGTVDFDISAEPDAVVRVVRGNTFGARRGLKTETGDHGPHGPGPRRQPGVGPQRVRPSGRGACTPTPDPFRKGNGNRARAMTTFRVQPQLGLATRPALPARGPSPPRRAARPSCRTGPRRAGSTGRRRRSPAPSSSAPPGGRGDSPGGRSQNRSR